MHASYTCTCSHGEASYDGEKRFLLTICLYVYVLLLFKRCAKYHVIWTLLEESGSLLVFNDYSHVAPVRKHV